MDDTLADLVELKKTQTVGKGAVIKTVTKTLFEIAFAKFPKIVTPKTTCNPRVVKLLKQFTYIVYKLKSISWVSEKLFHIKSLF